jgi:hypothetical protein
VNEAPIDLGDYGMKKQNEFLLVTRIGKKSLHRFWLQPDRNFDVFFSAFDKDVEVICGDGVFFEHRPGPKVAGYGDFLADHRELWQSYKYICLLDEDLETSTYDLNGTFTKSAELNLKISQPSLVWKSYLGHACTLRQPWFEARFVNFIEMMCPVFRTDCLSRVEELFNLGLESGIDLIWCNMLAEPSGDMKEFAIIDQYSVCHTQTVGKAAINNGFSGGRTYLTDIDEALARFNLPKIKCRTAAAQMHSGRIVKCQALFFLSSVLLFPMIFLQSGYRDRTKAYLAHMSHYFRQKCGNIHRNGIGNLD